ncbi:hypothetical protein AXG93_885s1140 [Marchantia polymorpha subsp. ruderalis]|uniref:Uncharacterized protein n=1 Tax=Marchantia polymorpha subsp. ruderalis TaxID=1480154 RepID=A0A176WE68_MARPO|nr:hypothetical protein AXG93_885s1140 [Marchantia polymorpha subsp. ruderalis]
MSLSLATQRNDCSNNLVAQQPLLRSLSDTCTETVSSEWQQQPLGKRRVGQRWGRDHGRRMNQKKSLSGRGWLSEFLRGSEGIPPVWSGMQCRAFPSRKGLAKEEERGCQCGGTFWCWRMEFCCQCCIYWAICEATASSAVGFCGGTEPWTIWAGFCCCWKEGSIENGRLWAREVDAFYYRVDLNHQRKKGLEKSGDDEEQMHRDPDKLIHDGRHSWGIDMLTKEKTDAEGWNPRSLRRCLLSRQFSSDPGHRDFDGCDCDFDDCDRRRRNPIPEKKAMPGREPFWARVAVERKSWECWSANARRNRSRDSSSALPNFLTRLLQVHSSPRPCHSYLQVDPLPPPPLPPSARG